LSISSCVCWPFRIRSSRPSRKGSDSLCSFLLFKDNYFIEFFPELLCHHLPPVPLHLPIIRLVPDILLRDPFDVSKQSFLLDLAKSSTINSFLRRHHCFRLSSLTLDMLSCCWPSLSLNIRPMAEWIVLPPIRKIAFGPFADLITGPSLTFEEKLARSE
jgi:hypothetical protein